MTITAAAPPRSPVARRDGGWRAARALARIEGPRLLFSPLVPGFTVITVLPGLIWWTDGASSLATVAIDAGILVWPLAGATLIASHLAVRRPIRDETAELFDAAPLPQHARTAGHLIAVVWPALLAATMVGILAALQAARGAPGPLPLFELATAPALVGGAGALGVLTARWVPLSIGWALGLFAVIVAEGGISAIQPEASRLRWLAPWVSTDQYLPSDLVVRDAFWHLVYLAGLIAVIGVLALLRGGISRPVAIAAASGVLLASVGAVAQTRQLSGPEAAALASRAFAEPHCIDQGAVSYCLIDPDSIQQWAEPVGRVLARVPDEVAQRGLVVRQRPGGLTLRALPGEVRALFPSGVPNGDPWIWPDDGTVQMDTRGSSGAPDELFVFMLKTASWTVGLPLEPGSFVPGASEAGRLVRHADRAREFGPVLPGRPAMLPCSAAGQARAVVALWLTAQAHPSIGNVLREGGAPGNDMIDDGVSHRAGIEAIPFDTDELLIIEPALWGADMPSPVLWGSSDVQYAMQLLDARGAGEVAATIRAHWGRFTDPVTPTSELVDAFGLQPLTTAQTTLPFDPVEPACR